MVFQILIHSYLDNMYFCNLNPIRHNMKKAILLIMALVTSIFASAQVTIQMEKEGGIYKVPCTVNGVKMKFIFDTGASTVSMSQTMAQFLLDGDYLSTNDIKGLGQSQLADGSIVNHASIVLRDVEIGGMHLHDIRATVIEGQNAPLLLGQTAIEALGRISIEGNRLIIHSAKKQLTKQQIAKLAEQAQRYIDADSYSAAIECFTTIDEAEGLSETRLVDLCYCYFQNRQSDDCIQACNRWVREYENKASIDNKDQIYYFLSGSYYFGFSDYDKALLWYQKELELMKTREMIQKYQSDKATYKRLLAGTLGQIASCHFNKSDYFSAISYYKQAVNTRCESLNVKIETVQQGKIQDDDLGGYLYDYAFCYYKQKRNDDGDEVMKLSAICGFQLAIDFCRKYGINYQAKTNNLFE